MCLPCYDAKLKEPDGPLHKTKRRVVSEKTNWRSDSYLGLIPDSHDWDRLAAYIDGEGTISLSPRKVPGMKSLTLCGKVVVTNTNFALTVWCSETFGMKFYVKRHGDLGRGWKDCYYSQAVGYRAAWLLYNCRQWLLLKGEQADLVMEHQDSTKVGTWERGSGVATPANLLEFRDGLRERLKRLNARGSKPA